MSAGRTGRRAVKTVSLLGLLLLCCSPAFAQFTQVSGTVTDPNGLAYAGGTISATLIPGSGASPTLNGASFNGLRSPVQLDINGSFQMQLPDNNVVLPAGSKWQFTVNIAPGILPPAGNGPQSFSVTLTITGASQNISASLNAIAPALSRITGGGGGGATLQTNGVNNTNQTLLNFITSVTNACGTTETPSNPAGGQVKIEETGTVNATCGGTGVSNPGAHGVMLGEGSSPMTPVTASGNGQCFMSAASNFATTDPSFQTCPSGFANPMTTIGDMIGGGTAGAATRIPGGLTGQVPVATNGATPAFTSPGIADGNAGAVVTSTPYVVLCDSATAIRDRATTIRFQSGAGTVTMPDHTASGCGANFVITLLDDGAGTLTINRSGADTFSIVDGLANTDGATSFTLANGQYVTCNNGATTVWECRKTGGYTQTICSGSFALATTAIASGAKSSLITQTCTGLLTSDNIQIDFASDPSAVTGYAPSASGTLTIIKFPTANTINVYQYNDTSASITPGAINVNYRAVR